MAVSPRKKLKGFGDVIAGPNPGTTLIVVEPMMPSSVAVMVVKPALAPVATPAPVIVALARSDDAQVTRVVTSAVLLLENVAVAENCWVTVDEPSTTVNVTESNPPSTRPEPSAAPGMSRAVSRPTIATGRPAVRPPGGTVVAVVLVDASTSVWNDGHSRFPFGSLASSTPIP